MSSRRYSAGSQKRRRGRTALVRSWHSAPDNQRTEGRATLILGASVAAAREHRPAATRARRVSDGSRVQQSTGSLPTTPYTYMYNSKRSQLSIFVFPPRSTSGGVVYR